MIVMVDVVGELDPLAVVKTGMSPEPLAARPILVLLLVHVNAVPPTGPDKFVAGAISPAQ